LYIKKEVREQVYNKCDRHCAYCGNELETIKDMQIDHIEPIRYHGTNDISNLNPSCRSCNHYKRALDLEQFRDRMITLHERIQSNYINKVAERYGIITVEPFSGKFYFEQRLAIKYLLKVDSMIKYGVGSK